MKSPCQVSEVNLVRKCKQRDTWMYTTHQPILAQELELEMQRKLSKCKTIRVGKFPFYNNGHGVVLACHVILLYKK